MGGDVVSRFKVRIYEKAYGNILVSKQIKTEVVKHDYTHRWTILLPGVLG